MKKLLILLFSILIAFNSYGESEGNIKDGKRDGTWTWWHENGQIQQEGNYKDDKKDGTWTYWDKNGLKSSEGNYKDDDLVDKTVFKYYDNGQIEEAKNY